MQQDYYELKIKINPEIFEIVSDICFENFDCAGVVQAEETYEDKILLTTTEGVLKAYLKSDNCQSRLGFPAQQHIAQTLSEQRELLLLRGFSELDLGSWEFELSKVENQDWSKKWKENWDVTHVSERITVVPSWIDYEPKEDEIIITLDPGSAFGTGTHPTTQLCMRAIEKYLKPLNSNVILNSFQDLIGERPCDPEINSGQRTYTIADIGTGSGILAICAVKFGAEFAYGCDNDETVIDTAIENAEMNNVSAKCFFECNTADKVTNNHVILNLIQDRIVERQRNDNELYKFDFITANILHNVLAEIMGDLKNLMKDNAKLVLSGIMDEKKQVVLDAIKAHNLKLIEEMHQDVWVAFVVGT